MKYTVRTISLAIVKPGEPLFSERCTMATIKDESAGEFVEIRQQSGCPNTDGQTIQIEPEEWESLKTAVDILIREIGIYESKTNDKEPNNKKTTRRTAESHAEADSEPTGRQGNSAHQDRSSDRSI